ncbi:hypothetical protein ATN84_08690 [Paramesorhizobium deserti]|uniref:Uncharacterized protein n=2 Tax=Paramesorhizobium deserti TaxID=1494590 RepID=A0A135HXA4_9HYPH|nr:hypothetical protein ATN84_08690 [Paramesorhizobium deserti]
MAGYLAVLADSDLFGTMALISLAVALMGLSRAARGSRAYQLAAFACLLFMPVLYGVGIYILNLPPA